MDVLYRGALAATGLAAGLIDTLASSGSAVSLPVLVMLDIPEVAANATNRLPVLIGLRLGFMVLDGATYVLPALMLGCHYALRRPTRRS